MHCKINTNAVYPTGSCAAFPSTLIIILQSHHLCRYSEAQWKQWDWILGFNLNFSSFHFNVIIKYTVYIYRKHNVVSHKCYFLRLQMGDERISALVVHMNYHTHCNCFPSSQRLKYWHSAIMRDYHDPYHKSTEKNSGKCTCCCCWHVQIWFKNVPCLSALGMVYSKPIFCEH